MQIGREYPGLVSRNNHWEAAIRPSLESFASNLEQLANRPRPARFSAALQRDEKGVIAYEGAVWLIGAVVCLRSAPQVHYCSLALLMPISCHLRDCRSFLVLWYRTNMIKIPGRIELNKKIDISFPTLRILVCRFGRIKDYVGSLHAFAIKHM